MLRRDDDYAAAGKPVCDYDDPAAREALVDALARDAMALLAVLDGRELAAEVDQAAQLLATVVGQDLDRDADGVFRIARRVATDRVISTVDPRGAARAQDLGARVRRLQGPPRDRPGLGDRHRHRGERGQRRRRRARARPAGRRPARGHRRATRVRATTATMTRTPAPAAVRTHPRAPTAARIARRSTATPPTAPGTLLARLETAGAQIFTKVQPPTAPGGRFTKDRFTIDLDAGTVTCPAG